METTLAKVGPLGASMLAVASFGSGALSLDSVSAKTGGRWYAVEQAA